MMRDFRDVIVAYANPWHNFRHSTGRNKPVQIICVLFARAMIACKVPSRLKTEAPTVYEYCSESFPHYDILENL